MLHGVFSEEKFWWIVRKLKRGLAIQRGPFQNLAPRAGFEPATCRLTVECSTAELPGIICAACPAEVRLLIQMLFRFAKLFFQKSLTILSDCGEDPIWERRRMPVYQGHSAVFVKLWKVG